MYVVHQDIEQRKVPPLRFSFEALVALGFLFSVSDAIESVRWLQRRWLQVLLGLEPGRQDFWTESDLGGDVECKLDDLGLGFNVEVNAVGTGNADEEVGEVGRKDLCFDKGIVLALD